jgi:hypothetical protein
VLPEIEAEGAAKVKAEKRGFLGVEKLLAEDPHKKANHSSHSPAPPSVGGQVGPSGA